MFQMLNWFSAIVVCCCAVLWKINPATATTTVILLQLLLMLQADDVTFNGSIFPKISENLQVKKTQSQVDSNSKS